MRGHGWTGGDPHGAQVLGMSSWDGLVSVDAVIDWLQHAPESLVEELCDWAEGVGDEDGESVWCVSPGDFASWWKRLSDAVDGTMPKSMQTDVKALFGEMAWRMDAEADQRDADRVLNVAVHFRENLIASGLAPGGTWLAELLVDRLENAWLEYAQWAEFDQAARAERFSESLRGVLASCDELVSDTASIPARRIATAVAAACTLWVSGLEDALERTARFFELERQAERENGDESSWAELTYVALAGVTANARLGNADGVHEVMRRIRRRAEPAGGTLPARFMSIWARGLRDLDPPLAQMISQQLLRDVYDGGPNRTDAAFAAAFLLAEMSALAGDHSLADRIANEWMPLALEAPHGEGSQMWINAFEGWESDEDA